jgi:outer membrane protein, multidrug efflux system
MQAAIIAALAAAAALAGCVNLAPDYTRPAAPIPAAWPMDAGVSGTKPATSIDWATFICDARLRKVIEITLRNNRDLRIAVLNIERARAQYRIERSARFPAIGASASAARQRTAAGEDGGASTTTQYNVELGFASYELDLFGRVKNLSQAALETFFAFDENRRSTQISLIAEVATTWLTLAADSQRLRLARDTLRSQQQSYELSRRTYELGGTSGLTLAQAQTTVEAARVEVARFMSQVALDRNALELLAGTALRDDLQPSARLETASILVDVPAGLPSAVLQTRPDVLAAERVLRASNANIGAARAAFFPNIQLTAAAGVSSSSLSNLFRGGNGAWSFVSQITQPIFNAGSNRATLQAAEAQRDIDIATYEKTLQVAFREVADALAQRSTLGEQLTAQQSLTAATARIFNLSNELFKAGRNSYLEVLDAQRTLYAAQQSLITLRLAEQTNRINLYKALGGGWRPASHAKQ